VTEPLLKNGVALVKKKEIRDNTVKDKQRGLFNFALDFQFFSRKKVLSNRSHELRQHWKRNLKKIRKRQEEESIGSETGGHS